MIVESVHMCGENVKILENFAYFGWAVRGDHDKKSSGF